MPQPVKLSDKLIDTARQAADLSHRSLAAQVEHWATLGRAIEGRLSAADAASLVRSVQEARGIYQIDWPASLAQRISDAIQHSATPEASARTAQQLQATGLPLYGTHADFPGKIVQQLPDGRLKAGRFEHRKFVPDE